MNIDWVVNSFKFKRDRRRKTLLSNSQFRAVLMTAGIVTFSWIYATRFDDTEIKFLGSTGALFAGLKYFLKD